MEFLPICELFEKLEKKSKRLEKILLLRDFLLQYKIEGKVVFDILAGNYQRRINKKNLGISLKTIFSVLNFLSKVNEFQIEKDFNKIGDIGEVSKSVLKNNKQKSLLKRKLTLKIITDSLKEISKTTGTNSNKKKKEVLSNLFLYASSDLEHKFLARLLIDDLRIGVSEGVLKEATLNAYLPSILGIQLVCEKCGYINLNLTNCLRCNNKLDSKNQEEIISKRYQLVELETPKKETSLLDYDVDYEINSVEYALRRNREKHFIKTKNPRELYNAFLDIFERKYNLINSFVKVIRELNEDISNLLHFEIILGTPLKSMLGTRAQTINESFDMVSKPAFIDFKYDGLRVQIHNKKGDVKLFSRNLEEITKQFPEVIDFIKDNFSDISFVIDSECVGYNFDTKEFLPFQILSRRILTKEVSSVSHINVVVKAFDILYLNGKTLIEEHYDKRRDILEEIFLNKPLKQKLHFNVEELKN